MKKIPLKCPSCEATLSVRSLHCGECGTEVTGEYELPILARLREVDQQFIIDFIKSSGSLKNMATNLKVSYPTVRNMLDDLIARVSDLERLEQSK